MHDDIYCYPNSDVLINKLNIRSERELYEAEVELTSIRLKELQTNPLKGNFDFSHLKEIHKYIFQDLYDWAGKVRSVEIGKGNLFCTTPCIQDYANSVFSKYFKQCVLNKDNFNDFIYVFATNYGDLNALHPFREGNGRAQREFARIVCLECGFKFDLSCTTHNKMLEASIKSFNNFDNSYFIDIFTNAVSPLEKVPEENQRISILTSDDLTINEFNAYDYYDSGESQSYELYNEMYSAKIKKMDAEKEISNLKEDIKYTDLIEKTIKEAGIKDKTEEIGKDLVDQINEKQYDEDLIL